MSLLLSSTALSLLAVVTVWLAGRRDPACSPFLTFGALQALLALPLLALLPKFTVEIPAIAAEPTAGTIAAVSGLALAWLVGFACFGARLLLDLHALHRWRRRALDTADPQLDRAAKECHRRIGLRRRVDVRIHPDCLSPSIAGLVRPVIYLPTSSRMWRAETLRMVLLHELGHVARRDLWTSLAAHLACLVHWFNPLVWWLRRRLLAQCEFACDARVIAVGADPSHYATALCDVAETCTLPRAVLAMADRASLRKRVERIVQRRASNGSLLVTAALLLTVTASFALSVVRLSPPPPASPGAPDPASLYTPAEIQTRLTADPFPAD